MTTPPGPGNTPSGDAPPPPFFGAPEQPPAPGGYPTPAGYPTSDGYPTPNGYPGAVPPPDAGRNGLAIAGLILAFLMAPIGFVLSLIAFVQTGKRGQKGRGMALTGMILGFLFTAIGIAGLVFVFKFLGNASTLADPGCIKGKDVILNSQLDSLPSDPTALRTKLQTVVTGLNAAAAAAEHDSVRQAFTAVADDYAQLVKALDSASAPPANLEAKTATDGKRIDDLCTIGGSGK